MFYLIVQTFLLLLIAGLLGMIFGWYLTRISAASARAALQTRLRKAEKEAKELRAELDALALAKGNCDTERRVLSDELAELRARMDAQLVAAEQPQAPEVATGEADNGGHAADSAAIASAAATGAEALKAESGAPPLLSDTEGDADDLRQIKGIGPKIAGILQELGIRRFDQIATWTPENVAWVNERLKFKGRIEREEWIPQAKALIAAREE